MNNHYSSTTTTCSLNQTCLIGECIAGNRKSQREMYNLFSSKMFAICLRYAKNQMDAEDILQEAFIKLFNNLEKFRNEGSFEGWVRRIFVNTAIEFIRKKSLNTTVGEGIENTVADSHKTPLDNMYEKDLIKRANTLSDGYRTIFNMYAIEGYSHKQRASYLGITESTSKSQYSRAKALLRNMLTAKPDAALVQA